MYLNDELNPSKRAELTVGGEQAVFKKVNETTVEITTVEPYYVLPTYLSSTSALSGHARWGLSALSGFAPAHYLKQFHPKYAEGGLDAVMKMAEDEGFDNWVDFFKQKNSVFHNTELPALTAWILEKPITEPVWVMKRNPYSIWMDEAGNQLPYMDKVQMTLGEDLEVLNLRAISGEFDQMLDGLGLTEKDSEGFRMRSDGKGRLVIEMQTYLSFMNFTELGEMVKEHWRDIGIDVDVKQLERSLAYQRTQGNEHQIHVEVTWGAEDMYGHGIVFFPSSSTSCFGPEYGAWLQSGGELGKEPTGDHAPLARVYELYRKGISLPDKARAEAGKELWRIVLDQVYGIGTVGQTPAIQGVRVVSNNLGNAAARHINSAAKDNPAASHPEQYYFKCLPDRDGSCP